MSDATDRVSVEWCKERWHEQSKFQGELRFNVSLQVNIRFKTGHSQGTLWVGSHFVDNPTIEDIESLCKILNFGEPKIKQSSDEAVYQAAVDTVRIAINSNLELQRVVRDNIASDLYAALDPVEFGSNPICECHRVAGTLMGTLLDT